MAEYETNRSALPSHDNWYTAVRSWLYVPGHRSDRFPKAVASGADAVIIDLEDAVAPDLKARARENAKAFLEEQPPVPVVVRINPLCTLGGDDLKALAQSPHLSGVRAAKADDPRLMGAAGDMLDEARSRALIFPLLESPIAVERASALATAHSRVAGVCLGEGDLRGALGRDSDDVIAWCRGRVVVAAAAAGLGATPMSAYQDLEDSEGLYASCLSGKRAGLFGRSALHPRQIPVIHRAFDPTEQEVAEARRVRQLVMDAQARGEGGVTDQGQFLDVAHLGQAMRVLRLVEGREHV